MSATPPPGWYTDPTGAPATDRYWDGTGWTGSTRPAELAAAPPPAAPTFPPPAPPAAPVPSPPPGFTGIAPDADVFAPPGVPQASTAYPTSPVADDVVPRQFPGGYGYDPASAAAQNQMSFAPSGLAALPVRAVEPSQPMAWAVVAGAVVVAMVLFMILISTVEFAFTSTY